MTLGLGNTPPPPPPPPTSSGVNTAQANGANNTSTAGAGPNAVFVGTQAKNVPVLPGASAVKKEAVEELEAISLSLCLSYEGFLKKNPPLSGDSVLKFYDPKSCEFFDWAGWKEHQLCRSSASKQTSNRTMSPSTQASSGLSAQAPSSSSLHQSYVSPGIVDSGSNSDVFNRGLCSKPFVRRSNVPSTPSTPSTPSMPSTPILPKVQNASGSVLWQPLTKRTLVPSSNPSLNLQAQNLPTVRQVSSTLKMRLTSPGSKNPPQPSSTLDPSARPKTSSATASSTLPASGPQGTSGPSLAQGGLEKMKVPGQTYVVNGRTLLRIEGDGLCFYRAMMCSTSKSSVYASADCSPMEMIQEQFMLVNHRVFQKCLTGALNKAIELEYNKAQSEKERLDLEAVFKQIRLLFPKISTDISVSCCNIAMYHLLAQKTELYLRERVLEILANFSDSLFGLLREELAPGAQYHQNANYDHYDIYADWES